MKNLVTSLKEVVVVNPWWTAIIVIALIAIFFMVKHQRNHNHFIAYLWNKNGTTFRKVEVYQHKKNPSKAFYKCNKLVPLTPAQIEQLRKTKNATNPEFYEH